MKNQLLLLLLFLFSVDFLCAQRMRKTNKFAFVTSANIGQTLPGYTTDQDRWKAGLHLSWGFNIGAAMRLSEHWSIDGGLGLTGFWMSNRGPYDNYILDFASPAVTAGLQYIWRHHYFKESFFRLAGGVQLGYEESFIETFEGYLVQISSDQPVYYFARPEIGFRKTLNIKSKVSRYPLQYEAGSFCRYYFNGLGEVIFIEDNFSTPSKPRGFTFGIFFRLLIPYGNENVRMKAPEEYFPAIIYNPRL
ncbi:MAG: hypothetical protein AAFZ15_08720 [Bacteroidota bacterium]